jgi:hypothetical protein
MCVPSLTYTFKLVRYAIHFVQSLVLFIFMYVILLILIVQCNL